MQLKVTQEHNLGIDEARNRLMKLEQIDDGQVVVNDLIWQKKTSTVSFDLTIKGVLVKGVLVIAPNYVSITTDDLAWYYFVVIKYAERILQNKLKEILT